VIPRAFAVRVLFPPNPASALSIILRSSLDTASGIVPASKPESLTGNTFLRLSGVSSIEEIILPEPGFIVTALSISFLNSRTLPGHE